MIARSQSDKALLIIFYHRDVYSIKELNIPWLLRMFNISDIESLLMVASEQTFRSDTFSPSNMLQKYTIADATVVGFRPCSAEKPLTLKYVEIACLFVASETPRLLHIFEMNCSILEF